MLVTLSNVNKGFLDEQVLEDINLSINEHDRIGLLGVNGIGKSTLLNIIADCLQADEGTVSRKNGLVIGYHRQNEALDSQNTLSQEIKLALSEVYELRKELEALSLKISQTDASSPAYSLLESEYEKLNSRYIALDGYSAEVRISTVLNGLGFGEFDLEMKTASLSGGEKIRFSLAKILLQNPELLILDEPTNHLDFKMLEWLEDYLKGFKGAFLIVSHDRYFLDKTVDDICEIDGGTLYRYKGGYSAFLKQKEERLKLREREYEKQQAEIGKLRDYVQKNLARSSSANSVGSRVKALEKAESRLIKKPAARPKDIHFKFSFDIEPHKVVLTLKDVGVFVGNRATGKQLYDNISLEVLNGEKIAIVGKNGVGKSSLIKAIMKKISFSGQIKFGGNVKVAYFDQELADLDLNDTVIEAVHKKFPSKTDYEIRSALGGLLIEDEAVFKKVRDLSGANRAKVQFCIIMFKRANVLILDEPTNHLDYVAKEALDEALKAFDGTLITVSHDRYFLNSVPTKIIEMFPDRLEIYNGNYDYYLEHRRLESTQSTPKKEASQNQLEYQSAKLNKAEERKKRAKINTLSKEIQTLEEEIASLKELSASEEVVTDYQRLSEVLEQIKEKENMLEEFENQWLELNL